jgi:hypothetical protein
MIQKRIMVQVFPDQAEALARLAKKQHTSMAGIMREALDDLIERYAEDAQYVKQVEVIDAEHGRNLRLAEHPAEPAVVGGER